MRSFAALRMTRKELHRLEQAFAKLEHRLRQAQARSVGATQDAVAQILERFQPPECAAFLDNSVYASA
jgi:hypothetical protein